MSMSSQWILLSLPSFVCLGPSLQNITKHPRFFNMKKNRSRKIYFWISLVVCEISSPLPALPLRILTRGKLVSSLLLLILWGLLVSRDIMRLPSVNYPAIALLWLTSKLNKQNHKNHFIYQLKFSHFRLVLFWPSSEHFLASSIKTFSFW